MESTYNELSQIKSDGKIECFRADLSNFLEIEAMAKSISEKYNNIDVIINNAGVFKLPNSVSEDGYDLRFVVNLFAPYLLTKRLIHLMSSKGRVINLSSAAQSSVDLDAVLGKTRLTDSQAYSQSKLALTMWSFHLADQLGSNGPVIIAVNPASFLASKMVKDAYGVDGNDLSVGADILVSASLDKKFEQASGKYFDNDNRTFVSPHPDALDANKNEKLISVIEEILAQHI